MFNIEQRNNKTNNADDGKCKFNVGSKNIRGNKYNRKW